MTWRAVWKHQLRWARTIRVCQPLPYFFSILSNAGFWRGSGWVWEIWRTGQGAHIRAFENGTAGSLRLSGGIMVAANFVWLACDRPQPAISAHAFI